MTTALKYAYGEIIKKEKLDDGSILVYGRVAGETLDLDKQILDKGWLDVSLPKWFSRGNVRAMHQPISAGKGVELTENGDLISYDLVSKIVDPVEVMKCENDVYTGYSVGIKNPRVKKDAAAPNGRIIGGDIVEVSIVDYPCDENNKLALIKGGFVHEHKLILDDADHAPSDEEVAKFASADATKSGGDDETQDIELAGQMIDLLKQLIASEVSEDEDEPYKLSNLLDVYISLCNFVSSETYSQELFEQSSMKMSAKMLLGGISVVLDEPTSIKAATPIAASAKKGALQQIRDMLRQMVSSNATASDVDDPAGRARTAANQPVHETTAEEIPVTDRIGPDATAQTPKVAAVDVTKDARDEATSSAIDTLLDEVQKIGKAVTPDALKTAVSQVVDERLDAKVAPLVEKLAELEKRAVPGGPSLGPQRQLQGTPSSLSNMANQQVVDLLTQKAAAGGPDALAAQQALRQMTNG